MEVTRPDPPLPQDVPPPWDSSPSKDKKAGFTAKFKVKHAAKNCQLSGPLQQLLSSSELETTIHDVFTEDGRKRVLLVGLPLDDLLPSKSPTLISLATLWVNLLLRKAVRIKYWSWAYVLHILNNEAISVTFDELFRESIHYSQGDIITQVFLTVLQNESLQDELLNFLKQFAQKFIAIQLQKIKNLELTVSSSVMESSELRFEFDSFTRGEYERVLQVCTTPDSSGEPPHLTAYLTILLDDADVSERLPAGCSDGEDQHTNSPADDPPPSSREAESISKVQDWLSRSDTSSSSPVTESDCQKQRIPIKGKSAFKLRHDNAIFRDISSSESDSEQVHHYGFSNPTHSFPTVAGASETLFEVLPSRANTIHRESMESTNELLPPGDTPLHSTVEHNITPAMSHLLTSEQCNPDVVNNDTNSHSGSLNSTKKAAQLCFQELASTGKSIRIVVTGQVGQGKLTLINNLMGKRVAKEGVGPRSVTHNMEGFTECINGVQVTVFDTPGFNDLCISDKDTKLELAKEICEKPIDLILFCVRMDRRMETEIDKIIQEMTQMFEQSIWEHAIFVLTFANKVEPATFTQTLANWDEMLHKYARTKGGVQAEIAQQIPVVVAGSEEESIPGYESWLTQFWVTAHNRIKRNGYLALTGKLNRLANFDSGDEEESAKDAVHSENEGDINKDIECTPIPDVLHHFTPDLDIGVSVGNVATSYVCSGIPQQPKKEQDISRKLATPNSISTSSSVNPSPNNLVEQPVCSTEQKGDVSTYRQSNEEASDKKLSPGAQESVDTQHLTTEKENDTIVTSLSSAPPSPLQLWHTELLKSNSNLESLKTFILSLPVEVLTLKDAVQGKTLCHALVGLVGGQFSSTDIIYLLGWHGTNLVEEAEANNKTLHTMIQTVTECQHSEELLPPPSAQPAQTESSSSSSSASSSEGGMTSLEADDSSDGGSKGVLSKAKCSTKRTPKKTIPAVQQCHPITTGTKKSSNLSVVYQCSGYSGDDSDHKNTCSRTKSSKFTSAQRTAAIRRKEQFNKESSSECSEAETEDSSALIRKSTDQEPTSVVPGVIKLTFQGTSCTLQIINCLPLMTGSIAPDSKSTELHHAVRQQYLPSVRDILACDGGEDQIQMKDEEGHTPLDIASQNKDLQMFELLLESLLCSQVLPSVTLPSCSGHQQMTLLASIIKVLSKKEIDIGYSTLYWTMESCQHWEIPKVVYTTPTTVLTTALLGIDLLWSYQNQLLMDTLLNDNDRTGSKKKRLMKIALTGKADVSSGATTTQELTVQNEQGITTSLHATTDRTTTDPTSSPATTDRRRLTHVVPDSPSYVQPKFSAAKRLPHKQVSRLPAERPMPTPFPKPRNPDSEKEVTIWQTWINKAVDCLHAGYYSQMLEVLKFGKVPPPLPAEIAMAAQFGCALAYYKLEKYSEAAKHLESLKTIAAAAQSHGNESIASVYLGDIEFTQSRYTEAAKHYSHALKLYNSDNLGKEYRLIVPTFSAISAKLGTAFRNTSKVVDAVQAYRQAIGNSSKMENQAIPTECSGGESHPTNSSANDAPPSPREAESISKVQQWLSQSVGASSSPSTRKDDDQRVTKKGKTTLKQQQTNAIFRDISSSDSDSEQVGHHGFNNLMRPFPALTGTSGMVFDSLPSRAGIIQAPEESPNIQSAETGSLTPLSTESSQNKPCELFSVGGITSLEANGSSDGKFGVLPKLNYHENFATAEPRIHGDISTNIQSGGLNSTTGEVPQLCLQEMASRRKSIRMIVTGQIRPGEKLVNSLIGKVVSEGFEPYSMIHNIQCFTEVINGVQVTLVNTEESICDSWFRTQFWAAAINLTITDSTKPAYLSLISGQNKLANNDLNTSENEDSFVNVDHLKNEKDTTEVTKSTQCTPVLDTGAIPHFTPDLDSGVPVENATWSTSYMCVSTPQNQQPLLKKCDLSRKLVAPLSQNLHLNPSLHDVGEQLVCSKEQGITTSNGQFSRREPTRKWFVKPPTLQGSVDTQPPEAEKGDSNGKVASSNSSGPSPPQLWDTKVLQNCDSLAILKTFIQSLPVEVQVLRDAAGKTLCHALVVLNSQEFSSTEVTHLLELLEKDFLQQCMVCQDSLGNTPLHCAIEAKAGTDIVKFLLTFATCEAVMIMNNDSLTPLELSFDKKLWSISQMLIEFQMKTKATCPAELLQEYILKCVKIEGGADLFPQILDLREHYCPDLDLNFSESKSTRTPWWYVANNDANAMTRVFRALKDHSIDLTSLRIRTEHDAKTLIEKAANKNEALIQNVAGWQYSEEDQSTPGNEEQEECIESAKELLLPDPGEPPSRQAAQIGASMLPSTTLSQSESQSSSGSSSEGGMTSLEADESSDGGCEETLPKTKCLTKKSHSKTAVKYERVTIITTKGIKSTLAVVHQPSGYSGDDSDHEEEDEDESKGKCTRTKSSKFTRAQRAAAMKKEQLYNDSSSEYSEAETENIFANTESAMSEEGPICSVNLKFCFSSCVMQILYSRHCFSLVSSSTHDLGTSTELHHAVRCQCLPSVRDILASDGGEDQIQMLDEGHTPLAIASQNKDLTIFELLLESLICSQVSPFVTLPPCSGHQLMTLLASIVKVLSKREIDIGYSTLYWTMVSCQHWKIPKVVYATSKTVLAMALLEMDLFWSCRSQLFIDGRLYRGRTKKKFLPVVSVAATTQKLAVQNKQEVTANATSSHATTDRTTEDSCLHSQPISSSMQFTHKQKDQELAAVQEQGVAFQSEMVSVTRMGDLILIRAYTNSLVTGLGLIRSKGLEFRQVRTSEVIPPHQPPQNPGTSTAAKKPNSADPTSSPATTDRRRLTHVVPDSPSYVQPKSSAAKLPPHKQVSQLPPMPAQFPKTDSEKEVAIWQAWINKAVDCLHAGYYSQMLEVLKFGKVPPPLPAEIAMAAQFGCALAYYKLEKYSEAAKHLESLKAIAASAQSHGNESIASVYLGDIEFTQSRYTEAAKHYSHALKLYNSDNLGKEYRLIVPTFSAISAKLGTAFRNTSKVVDAVQAYRQAIATADSKKDKLSAHTSLGNLFQSVGENASALAEYEHSIKLSEELRDYVSLGWAHGNMGNAYLGLYQRDKGLYHLEKALDLTVEHEPTPQAIGRAYNNLGTAFQALNELDKAEEKYDLALSQAIYGNDLPGQARVYGNIGNVLMLRKDYDRAIPHYTEVLRLSRDRSTVSTAFHNRGCSYYEWAESKKATLPQKARFTLHGSDFENYEVEHQPSFKSLPNSILKYYQLGRQDLEQVLKYHEETFENIKGSSEGLTLSVSLFETNSRTFHRLQDCLVNLGEGEKALVVAEQSRTRTLGELLVKRKNSKIDHPLTAPLNLQSISDIVQSQHSMVVYLSYTGARLLGWVLAPTRDKVSMDMFEVPLEDDQFDGKSFDYHLRYSLTEELVERSFEMYRAVDYKSDLSEPVRKLYKLVCKPLMKILKELKDPDSASEVQEMIIIPDSYTCLLPFPCLLDEEDKFLGDSYSFRIMPSLLTMGIVDQLPSVVVQVPADGRSMCVVGNPTIPSFMYNDDQWSLGKLPFATREAEWVANILKTTPILHEQATKDAVLMRIMNAKVIHIATHGSASAGFLAFAGMSSARNGETVEAKNVLLYPEDIERLSISPALVVLSSCDSGRGTVKADGILGMARAFILAGAQAVLTTLWRVPDESASVFMQFFYQYLMDELKASLALQKATLSVRCFSKYSQYIHWSGYQLTGREIQFDITKPCKAAALEARLGKTSVFPRLEVVQQLESAFLKDPRTPSDVQILRGSPGVKPSEPLVDFIHSFHDVFKGGIFWISCRRQELIDASVAYIKQATETVSTASQTHPILVVFDHIDQMPQFSDPSTSLMDLLKHSNTHIVVISKNYAPPDALLREIDHQLLRGCNIIDVKPLSPIHTTQRIVHSILSAHHLPPTNEDQNIFEKLAQFTSGSPALIDVTAALLLSQMEHYSQNESQDTHDTLVSLSNQLALDEMDPSTKPVTVVRHEPLKGTAKTREISNNVYDNIVSIRDPEQDLWCTSSPYDSWQAVTTLIDQCSLSAEKKLLLFAVSMFSCSPVPMSVVTEISSMIAKATHKPHISTSLHSKLFQMQLMKRYPLPVILHPSLGVQQLSAEPELVYVPQYIARAIWKDMMSDGDKVMALTTMYMALRTLADNLSSTDVGFLTGLTSLLVELYELNYELMGKQCYQEVYKLYLSTKLSGSTEKLSVMGSILRDSMFIGCMPSAATPHHPTPAPSTGATPLHRPTPAPGTGATPHEHDPDGKLAALHNKGITSSHLAALGASENSTEQGEESYGQSSNKERTLEIQENVDNQSPEAETGSSSVGSSTLPSNEFSEDSSCELSSGSDMTPPEADDELSSSGSHSTLVRHKRTMPAVRKRGGTTKEKKSSSLILDDLKAVTEFLLDMERIHIYSLGIVLGLRRPKIKDWKEHSDTFLDDIIAAWLRREDQVIKNGEPSWAVLIDALKDPRVGQTGIASDIAKKHCRLL